MSINSALLAGVSGLISNSSALAALSDNIANVNTVGYKRNQVNFANIVTAQAVQGRYSAGGVQAITRQYVSQQGLIQTSNSATDLAISGDGFFVVSDKSNPADNEARMFTRSGSFSVDEDGFMVNDSGLYLQGWPYDADEDTFPVNPSNLTAMESINVKELGAAVAGTTDVNVTANLNRNVVFNGTTWTSGAMAAYAATGTGLRPDFEIELNVIDSQGGVRKITMAFSKADPTVTPNLWQVEAYTTPASDIEDAALNGLIAEGEMVFNSDGTVNLDPAATPPTTFPTTLNIGASGGALTANWATALGLDASPIEIDFSKITQYASASTVSSITTNGAGVGNVIGINVDEDGVVTATYDNNQIRTLAKIGLATYQNPDALKKVSGNAYIGTISAGDLVIKEPNLGGAGGIAASALEASTVDLSSEFTGLIQTQKAYSASSKIITTADQMLEELINIKR